MSFILRSFFIFSLGTALISCSNSDSSKTNPDAKLATDSAELGSIIVTRSPGSDLAPTAPPAEKYPEIGEYQRDSKSIKSHKDSLKKILFIENNEEKIGNNMVLYTFLDLTNVSVSDNITIGETIFPKYNQQIAIFKIFYNKSNKLIAFQKCSVKLDSYNYDSYLDLQMSHNSEINTEGAAIETKEIINKNVFNDIELNQNTSFLNSTCKQLHNFHIKITVHNDTRPLSGGLKWFNVNLSYYNDYKTNLKLDAREKITDKLAREFTPFEQYTHIFK
ncbi:hypothetical protein [Silvanigrella aquatica]|uniref:Lipoprotein n=1 Tax=Silvanigrella aquatica TaxID=1915309 RepID=A0A1L4D1S6_9BACT|nr:hypothetical protein [Silvanigrella aquatica]APJ04159.1 hypothetical protein AXG55_09675 [Silvanigrella aquatica]